MSEKFDVPFKSDLVPQILESDSRIQFRCHKGVSCFNECCKQADVTLTPYDVLRLKDRLGMTSTDFLQAHTVPFQMDRDGLPGIKLRTDDEGACLFVTEDGCSVYEDRPTTCRYYPLGHMAMRKTGSPMDETHFFLVQEEHCRGHEEDRELTVEEYRQEQEVAVFDEMNHEWMQIILKKRSAGPAVGTPPEASLQLFFMCSFDADRFRRFVASESFRKTYLLDDAAYEELARDDIALMKFGYRLMRQVFYKEISIPERAGAWEDRYEARKEVFEARRQAELARKTQAEDEKYKDA